MAAKEKAAPDGRRLRRERGRETVIDALYELLVEGIAPTSEALVERSGVSLSSLFRYFASIDDLQREAIDRHFERNAALFEIPAIGEGSQAARIRTWVDARLALYEAIAPIGRLARARAHDQELLAATLLAARRRFAQQAADHFAAERAEQSRTQADDLVAIISSLTSFEAWDLLTTGEGRSRTQLRRAWTTALTALLA